MIEYLSIIINLILIWAVDHVRRNGRINLSQHNIPTTEFVMRNFNKACSFAAEGVRKQTKGFNRKFGQHESAIRKAAIAEKFAERAFTMASTANLGVIALQKSLQVPKFLTKVQGQRNQLAKNEVDKLFTTEGEFDYLRTILPQEEIDVLDAMERDKLKKESELNGAQ